MFTAYRRLVRELEKHKSEYLLFVVSLIIPAIIGFLSLNAFLELTASMKADELLNFDDKVTTFVYNFRGDALTPIVRFITDMGDLWAYLIIIPVIALLLYYQGHRWKLSIQATIVLASTFILNVIIKHWLVRPRPLEEMRLVLAHSYSFPSGHSMSAMAFYGFLIYLTFNYVENIAVKVGLITLQISLILAIGLSRVYLGVHYPSDVLAGFIGGIFWLIICIVVFKFINFYRSRRTPQPE